MRKSAKRRSEVGYGRPPVERQLQPSQSGNPRGRPRAELRKILRRVGVVIVVIAATSVAGVSGAVLAALRATEGRR